VNPEISTKEQPIETASTMESGENQDDALEIITTLSDRDRRIAAEAGCSAVRQMRAERESRTRFSHDDDSGGFQATRYQGPFGMPPGGHGGVVERFLRLNPPSSKSKKKTT